MLINNINSVMETNNGMFSQVIAIMCYIMYIRAYMVNNNASAIEEIIAEPKIPVYIIVIVIIHLMVYTM